jgi:uncharacterized protein
MRERAMVALIGPRRIPVATPPPRAAPLWFINPLAWGALAAIALYQRVIPNDQKPECLFTPSCSQYMSLAIRRYGVWRGVERGRLRLARCVGFVAGGEDWP